MDALNAHLSLHDFGCMHPKLQDVPADSYVSRELHQCCCQEKHSLGRATCWQNLNLMAREYLCCRVRAAQLEAQQALILLQATLAVLVGFGQDPADHLPVGVPA